MSTFSQKKTNQIDVESPDYGSITINDLPNEMYCTIFNYLDHENLLNCSEVNRTWFEIINEKLLRTESCLLTGQLSSLNCNKVIRGLILNNVNDAKLNKSTLIDLESVYLRDECYLEQNYKTFQLFLHNHSNLINLTVKLKNSIKICLLEDLLVELKLLKNICLIFNTLNQQDKEQLINFFSHCYHFYDEIVIQILRPVNHVIYITSNKKELHKFINHSFDKVTFGHVSYKFIENILLKKNSKASHFEFINGEHSKGPVLEAICKVENIESLTLNKNCPSKQAWRTFFKMVNTKSYSLKELKILNCENFSDEHLSSLSIRLDQLHLSLEKCCKIVTIESFVVFCLQNVSCLNISFNYSENYLNDFVKAYEMFSNVSCFANEKHVTIEIQRVNHCSDSVSRHVSEFKSTLYNLSKQCSIATTISEIFTKIS